VGDGDRELAEGAAERELALLAVGDGDRELAGRALFSVEGERIGPGFASKMSHSRFSIGLNSAMDEGLMLHKLL